MPLSIRSEKPSTREAIHVGGIDDLLMDGVLALSSPASSLVERELAYWESVIDNGVFEGRKDLEDVGLSIHDTITKLKMGAVALAEAIGVTPDQMLATVFVWQQRMAAAIAMSQLLQVPEVAGLLQEARPPKLQPGDDEAEEEGPRSLVLIDHNPAEPSNSGLHLDDYLMGRLELAVPAIGQEQWYEGQYIYVRVQRPAHITARMQEVHLERRKRRLDRTALTSLAARVKQQVWHGALED